MRSPDKELKALCARLIEECGGLAAAAAAGGVGTSQMSDYQVLARDAHMPVDVLAKLEHFASNRAVTAALALRHGCILVPVAAPGQGPIAPRMALFGKEVTEVFTGYAVAMADDHLSAAEARGLLPEVADVLRVAQELFGALTAMAEGGA